MNFWVSLLWNWRWLVAGSSFTITSIAVGVGSFHVSKWKMGASELISFSQGTINGNMPSHLDQNRDVKLTLSVNLNPCPRTDWSQWSLTRCWHIADLPNVMALRRDHSAFQIKNQVPKRWSWRCQKIIKINQGKGLEPNPTPNTHMLLFWPQYYFHMHQLLFLYTILLQIKAQSAKARPHAELSVIHAIKSSVYNVPHLSHYVPIFLD